MVVQLLLAPATSGKTQHAIQVIREVLSVEPLARISVILPNQIRVVEFQRRLAIAGGTLGVNLFTFHTLYAEILSHAGQPRARLLDTVQIRLLQAIIDRLDQEDRLHHYASLRTKPGFITTLRAIIEELKRARIEPKDFSTAVNGMGARLEEIAAIYSAYQEWLLQQDWADSEGRGWLAALALAADHQLERGLRLLVVNGFDEFNPTQLSVLTLLTQRARQTLITLTGDLENPGRLAHRRFQRAQQAITTALDLSPTPLPAPALPPPTPLDHLEANLFELTSQPSRQREKEQDSPSAIRNPQFLEAQTRTTEARAALRWVKTCLVRDGFSLSEVAIMARDLTPYRPFLEETGIEFGVPLRILSGLPLAENPAIAALLSLLSIPALDWPRGPVLATWASPYFDWSAVGISQTDSALLDNASRLGRVISGLSQWQEAFDLLARRKPFDEKTTDEEDSLLQPLPFKEKSVVRRLREKFNNFTGRIMPPPRGTLGEYVAFLEDLIGDDPVLATHFTPPEEDASLRVVACARENAVTAERDVAALRAFKDVLRGLVLSEAVLGMDMLAYPEFYTELRKAVKAAIYTVPLESGVLVASVVDARGLCFRAVAILGLSEGEFPQPEREDPFLSEADRNTLRERGLSIESKLHGDEVTFFYQAVTRARERLLFCRPYLADDGQPWEPSPYWLQVWRMFGSPRPQRVRPEDILSPEEAASPVEFAQTSREGDVHLQAGVAILQSRLTGLATNHEGNLPELSPCLNIRFSPSFVWSASKLESYGTCPFYFYVAYALELEPRIIPEEGYDVRMLGSMLHQILELTYNRANDPTQLTECMDLLPEVAAEVFASAPTDYGFRPTLLWKRQQEELTAILRQTLTALADISQGYTPRYFEPKFGMGNPSLALKTAIGEVRLHGYIDRVDEGPDGRLRIIDYKAGSAAISPRHLEEGRRLQLPIYALAARDALGLGEIGGGFYWHIAKGEASSLKLEKFPGGVQAAFEIAEQHIANHLKNIRSGQFKPQPPKEGCPSYCPAVGFCWQYRKRF